MKIYTKTGDGGTTTLFGGKRVDKNSARIEAYGCVDELNSLIGVVIAQIKESSLRVPIRSERSNQLNQDRHDLVKLDLAMTIKNNWKNIVKKFLRIQGELFVLGTDLATPTDVRVSTSLKLRGASKIPRVTRTFVTRLEKEIDFFDKLLPALKSFILPGGSKTGSKLHFARTIARRAERRIVDLSNTEKINQNSLVYINRLSDWLFVLARYVNQLEKVKEVPWKGRGR
ncbi:MAG: cob(I)yrinic acid a,c-diamide adenosyltransferase [Patescibacteria group bacterium]